MHSLWDVLLSVSCNIYFKQNNGALQHQTFYNQNTCKCYEYGGSENKSLSSKPSGFTLQHHTICQVNLLVFCEISNCSNGKEKPKTSMINNKAKCLKPWQLPGFWTSLSNIPKIILKRTGHEGLVGVGGTSSDQAENSYFNICANGRSTTPWPSHLATFSPNLLWTKRQRQYIPL